MSAALLYRHPHAAAIVEEVERSLGARPKQTCRMHKCQCDVCGFTFRATRQWIDGPLDLCCPDATCDGHMQHD